MELKPFFKLAANGTDISADVDRRLIELRVTDISGEESDTLDVRMEDVTKPQLILPPTGAELEVFIGYDGNGVRKGLFVADEINIGGPPSYMTIRARSAPFSIGSMGTMQEQKTRSWDNVSIVDLVHTIAQEHGLEPVVSSDYLGVPLGHIDQIDESDMHLLTRIARDNGAIAKPANGTLIFAPRAASKAASGTALPTVALTMGDISRWDVVIADRSNFRTVVASWHDLATGLRRDAMAGTGEPVHRMRQTFPDEASALRAARSRLAAFQRGASRLSLDLPGRPDLTADGRLTLTGVREGADGEWLVVSVEHVITTQGYATRVEAETPP